MLYPRPPASITPSPRRCCASTLTQSVLPVHALIYTCCVASLGLQVDRNGDIPVGTQLSWQIQALITEGQLRSGERLPSVRALAEATGVNVNTIRSVYDRLEGEGFVRTEHGRGSFVAENVP